jgi:hypothetical protein
MHGVDDGAVQIQASEVLLLSADLSHLLRG